MAITVVQAGSTSNNNGSNLDLTVTLAVVTAGNALIIWAQSGNLLSTPPAYLGSTATDGGSDSFTLLAQSNDTVHTQYGGLWFCNSSVGGFTTVTVSFSTIASGFGFSTMTVYEVSGLAASASDTGTTNVVAAGAGSSATNGDTAGAFTVGQTGELIVGGFFNDNGSATTWTAGTSPIVFTIPSGASTSLGGVNPHTLEYSVWAGSGSVNPTITLGTTDGYIAVGWGFKANVATALTLEDDSFKQFQPQPFDPIVSVW